MFVFGLGGGSAAGCGEGVGRSGGRECLADAGAGAGGDDECGGEDECATEAGAGAEAFVQDEDAEERAEERLHVEQHAGLRCGHLGHPPIP